MADLPDVAAQAVAPSEALARIWADLGLDNQALDRVTLSGAEPALRSSFAVGTAAQVAIAASALAAVELGRERGQLARQVTVDLGDAVRECTAHFSVNGVTPPVWDPISGLYPCGRRSDPDRAAGWIRIHANFPHHRDGAIHLLGLGGRSEVSRDDVARALANWRAEEIEEAADELGLPMAALRTTAQWQAHPQARLLQGLPLVAIEQIGEAPPRPWPTRTTAADSRNATTAPGGPLAGSPDAPLSGLRVLDLTRVLAGPIACRTLASLGAEVLTVHAPGLPNIAAWPDTSRGKRSAELDFRQDPGPLQELVRGADVFFEAARPGAIAASGFGPEALHRLQPGIVCVSLDAWGDRGPWGSRRGFDSLVQTATGLNDDERLALGGEQPQPLPVQILDYATGFLASFGIQVALMRQRRLGGSWRVHLSLARTAAWLRSLGRLPVAGSLADESAATVQAGAPPAYPLLPTVLPTVLAAALVDFPSDFGTLRGMPHAARFSDPWLTPALPSGAPGRDPARWMTR